MAATAYTPAATSATEFAFTGVRLDDPGNFSAHDPVNVSAKYVYWPIQNEILALIKKGSGSDLYMWANYY